MIKLVQGFDVCSPLPIDGRILLSKKEMYEIDDNIMPERYFAICKEDGKLYLYNKFNVITEDIGKFRLADDTTDERITREVKTLNNRIDDEVETLNSTIEEEDTILDARITDEVANLNETINTKEAALQTEDQRLDQKIDDYKVSQDLVNNTELTTKLAEYSLGDEAATKVVLSMDTTDYVLKVQLFNRDDVEISSSEVNTPIEEMVIDADYDADNEKIILHLKNGHDVEIPIGALISDLVTQEVFDAHVANKNPDAQHINTADRTRWNETSREAVVRYDVDDPDNDNSLYKQLVPGSNVGIDTTGSNKVRISAKDTIIGITSSTGSISITSTPTPSVPDGITYDLNTEAAAPSWISIQGEDPLENRSLNALVEGINTRISAEETARANAISEEASTRTQADEDLSGRINSLSTDLTTLSGDLTAEVARAQEKENELSGSISDLDTRLSGAISDEEARAEDAEEALRNSITSQVSDEAEIRERVDNEIKDSINSLKTNEIKNLQDKDVELESSLNAEKTNRETADSNLQSAIDGEITSRENADTSLNQRIDDNVSRIEDIESKIPNAASSSNQLADKEFVNSSIATATAKFIGTFNSKEELEQETDVDENDYAFVVVVDSEGNTIYERYKYTSGEWLFEYELNNSSFTAEQWKAINSGATIELIDQITTNKNNIESLTETKVDKVNDKSLIANEEIERLKNIISGATKVTASTNPGDGNIQVQSRTNGVDSQVESINVYLLDSSKVIATEPYIFGEGLTSAESDGKVTVKFNSMVSIDVPTTAWTAVTDGFGFVANVNLAGITENSEPFLDVNMNGATSASDVEAINNAWGLIYRARTDINLISLYAYAKPTIALTINVKGY